MILRKMETSKLLTNSPIKNDESSVYKYPVLNKLFNSFDQFILGVANYLKLSLEIGDSKTVQQIRSISANLKLSFFLMKSTIKEKELEQEISKVFSIISTFPDLNNKKEYSLTPF